MTVREIIEGAKAKLSTISFGAEQYGINLKAQTDFKKFDNAAYVLVGYGLKVNYSETIFIDENDNVHSRNIPALAYVKVGEAMHKDEFPVYAVAKGYKPQEIGTAKMIKR